VGCLSSVGWRLRLVVWLGACLGTFSNIGRLRLETLSSTGWRLWLVIWLGTCLDTCLSTWWRLRLVIWLGTCLETFSSTGWRLQLVIWLGTCLDTFSSTGLGTCLDTFSDTVWRLRLVIWQGMNIMTNHLTRDLSRYIPKYMYWMKITTSHLTRDLSRNIFCKHWPACCKIFCKENGTSFGVAMGKIDEIWQKGVKNKVESYALPVALGESVNTVKPVLNSLSGQFPPPPPYSRIFERSPWGPEISVCTRQEVVRDQLLLLLKVMCWRGPGLVWFCFTPIDTEAYYGQLVTLYWHQQTIWW
jgi:hypothetical protein